MRGRDCGRTHQVDPPVDAALGHLAAESLAHRHARPAAHAVALHVIDPAFAIRRHDDRARERDGFHEIGPCRGEHRHADAAAFAPDDVNRRIGGNMVDHAHEIVDEKPGGEREILRNRT
jgi:hypothetical protein